MHIDYQTVTFGIGVIGVVFGVYRYFKDPQISSDKTESLFALQLQNMRADLINLRDNHVHTLDVKIDDINSKMGLLENSVTRLATIIDERIPKK